MKTTFIEQLKQEITKSKFSNGFCIEDLNNNKDKYETIKKTLFRLEKRNFIVKVTRGIYYKPIYNKTFKMYSTYEPYTICLAIARKHNWVITPYGERSLNMLGVSTQLSNVYEFASSGPNKTLFLGKIKVSFIHRPKSEFYEYSNVTRLVIQALNAIGRRHITKRALRTINMNLKNNDRAILFKESKNMKKWLKQAINIIWNFKDENGKNI